MFNIGIPIAASFGYFSGLIVAYILMSKRLFKNGWLKKKKKLEITLFAFSGLIGILTTYLTTNLYIIFIDNNIHIAKFTAVIISFTVVYMFRKKIVFKKVNNI